MKFRYFVMHNHRIEHDFDLKLILYRVFTGQVQLHRKQSLFQNVNFSIFEFATLSKEFSKTRQSSKRERERDDDIRRMTSYASLYHWKLHTRRNVIIIRVLIASK